ncbi:MAG: hypothetical protein ACNYPI_10820 [Arenicellales bacterium WSBS_2016_MAG_OTU3]
MTLHLSRNVSHFVGQNLWFYAVGLIPLSQLFAFEFTTPLQASLRLWCWGSCWTTTAYWPALSGSHLDCDQPDVSEINSATLAAAFGGWFCGHDAGNQTLVEYRIRDLYFIPLVTHKPCFNGSRWYRCRYNDAERRNVAMASVRLTGLAAHASLMRLPLRQQRLCHLSFVRCSSLWLFCVL